jgi:hypothetical protein
LRHDLHQAHGAFWRQGTDVATAFRLHDGAYRGNRECETMRCLSHEASKGISHCNDTGMAVAVWLSMRNPNGQQQHNDT